MVGSLRDLVNQQPEPAQAQVQSPAPSLRAVIQQQPETQREGPLLGNPAVQEGLAITRQFTQGALELLNLPQEGVDAALNLFGVNLPRGPRLFDFKEPETTGQAAANLAGAGAAGMLIPGGVGLQGLRAGTQSTTALGGFSQQFAKSLAQRPATVATQELAAGAGAGSAGFQVEKLFPDSSAAKAFAEIAGGVAGGFAPALIGGGAGSLSGAGASATTGLPFLGTLIKRSAQSIRDFLTPQGAFRRAKGRIERATDDPQEAARRAEETPLMRDAPLTEAQRTGDEGLLALERSIMQSSDRLSRQQSQQFTEVNQAIRESLESTVASPRRVNPEQAREFLGGLLETRIAQAQAIADERLRGLAPTATREDANRLAAEELRRVMNVARRQEAELWEAIPSDLPITTDNSRLAFSQMEKSLSKAQRDSLPDVARRLLSEESDEFLGPVTDFNEIRGLRSELREQARIARADGKFNKARLSDGLADSLAEDLAQAGVMTNQPEARQQIEIATAFSRDLNDRFTRGEVGRLLGTNRDGGSRIPDALTLETTVGTGGPRAKVATDAMLTAVQRSGDEEVMGRFIQDFLKEDFNRFAVRGDRTIDTRAATRFIEGNQDTLSRFPELRRAMEQARDAGEIVSTLESVTNPRLSRAAIFLNAPPGREMERILASTEPRKAVQQVIELAGRDPQGLAIGGLRTAFLNRVMDKAAAPGRGADLVGDPFISGRNLFREMNNPAVRQVAEELLSPAQREQMTIIANTARRLDLARESPEALEGIIGDAPGLLTTILARFGGAQIGNIISRNFGGSTIQTPAIFSSAFQRVARAGVNDPASSLLTEAFQPGNEQLFRSLLLDAAASPQREDFIRTRLNAWIASTGAEPLTREDVQAEVQRLQAKGQQ